MRATYAITVIALMIFLSGCTIEEEKVKSEPATTSSISQTTTTYQSTTTTEEESTTSSTVVEVMTASVLRDGCECMQWVCPTQESADEEDISTTTSTTCITVEDDEYIPRRRYYNIKITDGRFRPDEIKAFLGDTIIANITSKQGLHRIRETYSNKTIIIKPDESYELIFYALRTGQHLMTCNPYCIDPMEAKIIVENPTYKICS
ncbi:MAG: hypothetical protein KKD39_05710 [Candidatus Altiarchaeota archaeon]|nr:hypothetical protein [Candidatus Altiarchaeota archaeon]